MIGRQILRPESDCNALQGLFELRQGSADVALPLLDRAVQLDPPDELPLVARSRCLVKAL